MVLESGSDPVAPSAGVDGGQVGLIERDRAGGWPIHSREELDQCGLAGAVLADDGNCRSCREGEREVVQGGLFGTRVLVGEAVETDPGRESIWNCGGGVDAGPRL